MPSKMSFTYEHVPDQWDKSPKISSGLVIEDVTNLQEVLEQFKNFLSSAGYVFDANERLDVVADDESSMQQQDQTMNQGEENAS